MNDPTPIGCLACGGTGEVDVCAGCGTAPHLGVKQHEQRQPPGKQGTALEATLKKKAEHERKDAEL